MFCRFYIQNQIFMNNCMTKYGKTFEYIQKTFYEKRRIISKMLSKIFSSKIGVSSIEENNYETWREED